MNYAYNTTQKRIDDTDYLPTLTVEQYRSLLEKSGHLQTELAKYLGITPGALQYWWFVYDEMPVRNVLKLRKFLGDDMFLLAIKAHNNGCSS